MSVKTKICGIYCIENMINEKKYIGQSVNIYSRWYNHKSNLRSNRHKNAHLQNAWNVYGECNFKFYILEECCIDMLDDTEKKYIQYFNVLDENFGYNVESGGHELKQLSEQTKEKIRNAHKGKPLSEEHKAKIGRASKGHTLSDESRQCISDKLTGIKRSDEYRNNKSKSMSGENNPNYGIARSEYVKRKIAEGNSKSVYCIELNMTFSSAKQAENITHVNRCNISACCHNRRQTAGYHPVTGVPLHWMFVNQIALNSLQTIQN